MSDELVRETDTGEAARQAANIDLARPLPPEPRLNVAMLLEVPLGAATDAIFEALGAHGHGEIRRAHQAVFSTVAGEGSRLTDMAAAAKITKQSMQYLVDDLVRLGYAERIPDPGDARAKLVRLTRRGRAATLVARDAISDTERRWGETLGAAEMRRLRVLLEELCAALGVAR